MPPTPGRGRRKGSTTINRSAPRTGPPRGHRPAQPADWGPATRVSPFDSTTPQQAVAAAAAAAAAAATTATTATATATAAATSSSAETPLPSELPVPENAAAAAIPPIPLAPPIAPPDEALPTTSSTAAASSTPSVTPTTDPNVHGPGAGTALPPRQADGRFGRKSQQSDEGRVQRDFRDEVKAEIGTLLTRSGHGKKHGVTGALPRGSPWFFPEDMQKAAIPNRDVHLRTAVYLVCREFYDSDIVAPPCPYCGKSDDVRYVPAWPFGSPIFVQVMSLLVSFSDVVTG